ncbi:hypothetical protein GCM10027203_67840 [Nonomuraea fastidiosa]|jgi:hypothetical protein
MTSPVTAIVGEPVISKGSAGSDGESNAGAGGDDRAQRVRRITRPVSQVVRLVSVLQVDREREELRRVTAEEKAPYREGANPRQGRIEDRLSRAA